MFNKFCRDENGATAIEYGLIAAMFGAFMISAFVVLSGEYSIMFGTISDGVINANNP